MKWKNIKDLYIINPSRWEEADIFRLYYEKTPIRLSFLDYIKYLIAYNIYNRNKKKQRENSILEKIIRTAQEDIEEYKEGKTWRG